MVVPLTMLRKRYCSPDRKSEPDCFSASEERVLKDVYNRTSGKRPVKSLRELKSRLKTHPACFVSAFAKLGVDAHTLQVLKGFTEKAHLPQGPDTPDAWLWSNHILSTMARWVRVLPKTFTFLGAMPADFYGNPKLLIQAIRKSRSGDSLGVVMNTDPSHKAGQHWVGMLLSKSGSNVNLEYFDALGDFPNRYTRSVLKTVPGLSVVEINQVEHQKGDGQCGVFSVYYILSRVLGVYSTMKDFNDHSHTDASMKTFRPMLFRPKNLCDD